MIEKESLLNNISQDLIRRNRNWEKVEELISLKADKTYVDNKVSGIIVPEGGLTPESVKAIKVNQAINSDTVNGYKVHKDVPVSALFTDTIVDTSNKVDKVLGKGLSANDYTNVDKAEVLKIKSKADKQYIDDKVKTNVPLNARFTDTIFNPNSITKFNVENALGYEVRKIVVKEGTSFSSSELGEGEIGFLY